MNSRYTVPGAMLGLAALICLLAMDSVGKKADLAKADLEKAVETVVADRAQTDQAKQQLAQAEKNSGKVTEFLSNWSLPAQDATNVGNIVERMAKLSIDRGLLATRRPTPTNDAYPLGGKNVTIQQVGFTVTGPYPAAIAWLGEVEASFPFGRPERIDIRGKGNDIEMEVNVSFLLVDAPSTRN